MQDTFTSSSSGWPKRRIASLRSAPRSDRFSDEALNLLRQLRVHSLHPFELEQFHYENEPELHGDKIVLRTDEIDVSAFFKLMVSKGARVRILSRHDHPQVDGGESE